MFTSRSFLAVALVGVFASHAFAQMPDTTRKPDSTRGHMGMDGKGDGMMGGCMGMHGGMGQGCPMHSAMMRLIPTEDGGIIVVSGTKMTKYDKNLERRKEQTIAIDTTGMKRMMEMMAHCPGMPGGMPDTSSGAGQ